MYKKGKESKTIFIYIKIVSAQCSLSGAEGRQKIFLFAASLRTHTEFRVHAQIS